MSDRLDYLIVGQGLAGSLLAWELVQRQRSLMIIDNRRYQSSSMVASGLVNPVTGQRLHALDNILDLLNAAQHCYRELETHLSRPLLHPLPMLRLAKSEKDKQLWLKRRQQAHYSDLIGDWRERDIPTALRHPFGGFEQYQCARLDIPALLNGIQDEFLQQQRYTERALDYEEIRVDKDAVHIGELRAGTVIFCEGHHGRRNPWFDANMWNISRGDILRFRSDRIYPMVVHFGFNYVPLGDDQFDWGASFDSHSLNILPSAQAHAQLMEKLITVDAHAKRHQLITQYCGLRPATRDKKPVMGRHPELTKLAIFNGFGAKGSLMAPYYAKKFADYLELNLALPNDVDYSRFVAH